MKPSKYAMFDYLLGLIVFIISFVMFLVVQEVTPILIGLSGMTLLWVIGVQQDLYQKEENKP